MLAHYSKSLHHPYFNQMVVLEAYRISKENEKAGALTFEKMSAYGHGEGEDEKRQMLKTATNLQCTQKTLSRLLLHEKWRDKYFQGYIYPWRRRNIKRGLVPYTGG